MVKNILSNGQAHNLEVCIDLSFSTVDLLSVYFAFFCMGLKNLIIFCTIVILQKALFGGTIFNKVFFKFKNGFSCGLLKGHQGVLSPLPSSDAMQHKWVFKQVYTLRNYKLLSIRELGRNKLVKGSVCWGCI